MIISHDNLCCFATENVLPHQPGQVKAGSKMGRSREIAKQTRILQFRRKVLLNLVFIYCEAIYRNPVSNKTEITLDNTLTVDT